MFPQGIDKGRIAHGSVLSGCVEIQLARHDSQSFAEELQNDDQKKRKGADGRLDAEGCLGPLCIGPRHLEVGDLLRVLANVERGVQPRRTRASPAHFESKPSMARL